jgi:uncharacterized protein
VRFWDSSAIVPLLTAESASRHMSDLFQRDRSLTAWWGTVVECEAAICRLRRSSPEAATAVLDARLLLEDLSVAWVEVEPSEDVRRLARRSLGRHPLRAADAFQLAAALFASRDRPADLPFVCLDDRLAAAARLEGFPVIGAPS